jgi:hypothetical protein
MPSKKIEVIDHDFLCKSSNPIAELAHTKSAARDSGLKERIDSMNKSMKTLMLTAAVSGLLGGTAARLQATQTTPVPEGTVKLSAKKANAGKVSLRRVSDDDKDKHSCKGKNDCKGKGGCKSSDNGCKGKNDCKGKGGCATDGSKPPSEFAA